MDNPIIRVATAGRVPLVVVVEAALEVGRECDGLLVVDERVSRRHLRLDNRDGGLLVTDLDSSNGTFIDGDRIDSPVRLLADATVTLGNTSITLLGNEAGARSSGTVIGNRSVVRPQLAGAAEAARRTGIDHVAAAVAEEAQPLVAGDRGDETVTIMFSDIESSTEQALAVGDAAWMTVLRVHQEIFERRVAQHAGTIIKNQGDGYMITFASARRAVLCAAAVQRDLADHADADADRAIRVRMGCHTGEAIRESGDLFGRHVIIAARIANLADGAQILVSAIVKEITAARGDLTFAGPDAVTLKGLEGSQDVYAFDWRSAPGVT